MPNYAGSLVRELATPLLAALNGLLEGPGKISTILLCETLLGLLPKMSLKDMPYSLLRDYKVMPVEGGVIGTKRHIHLKEFPGMA